MAPTSAPTPKAELRYPTPASPISSSSIATTTRKTSIKPATSVWAVNSPISTRSSLCWKTTRKPAMHSLRIVDASTSFDASASRDVHPENDERRDPEHRRRDREDDVDPGHGEQETGDGRTEEEREALHGAGHGVRGGQLAWRRSQRRHDRRLRGLVRGVGDRCDDRERVDELCRSVLPDAHCGSRTETEAEQSRDEKHDLAPVPVPEHADERREQPRRDEAEQEDDADRFLATLVVGVDRDGHQQAPMANGNRRPGALEPAQICAAEDGRE